MAIFDDIFNLYWEDKRYCINNKQIRTRELVQYMLDRTQQIFVWENLPDTIPQHNLEYLLQCHGSACITEVADVPSGRGEVGLYAFFGGLGGVPNAYYEPTIYTIANPYLEFNKELEIGKDCVWARNDKFVLGLLPMFIKYGAMLNENEISMNMLSICYRIDNLISADNDRTFESAKEYFNGIIDGQFGAISSSEFFDGIRNDKTNSGSRSIKDLIEYQQYIKASWYNEIGLNSNYNMKRERIVASEAEMTDDALIPLVDNMLSWRLKACEQIKEMYGDRYNLEGLTVKLNAVWDLDRMFVDVIPEAETQPEETEVSARSENGENEDNYDSENDNIADDNSGDNAVGNEGGLTDGEENQEGVSAPMDDVGADDNTDATIDININIDMGAEIEETEEIEVQENDVDEE